MHTAADNSPDPCPVALIEMLIDIKSDRLVLGFLDHMPEDKRHNARIRARKQLRAVTDQPFGYAHCHGFEPGSICQAPSQRLLLDARIIGLHLVFNLRKFGIAARLEEVVEPAMVLIMLSLLRIKSAGILQQRWVIDLAHRFAHGPDKKGLKIGHGHRRPVQHMAPLRLLLMPDGFDTFIKGKRNFADDDVMRLRLDRHDVASLLPARARRDL